MIASTRNFFAQIKDDETRSRTVSEDESYKFDKARTSVSSSRRQDSRVLEYHVKDFPSIVYRIKSTSCTKSLLRKTSTDRNRVWEGVLLKGQHAPRFSRTLIHVTDETWVYWKRRSSFNFLYIKLWSEMHVKYTCLKGDTRNDSSNDSSQLTANYQENDIFLVMIFRYGDAVVVIRDQFVVELIRSTPS